MTEPFHNICPQCLVVLSHLRGGLMAMCALLWISINKLYRGQLGEGERIPVGKPNGSHAIRFCSRSAAAVCREVRPEIGVVGGDRSPIFADLVRHRPEPGHHRVRIRE